MLFSELAEYFEKIEITSSRNEITKILAELLKKADEDEIDKICYLSLGRLLPSYKGVELSIAEKIVSEVIASFSQKTRAEIEKEFINYGDWGQLTYSLSQKEKTNLKVNDVYKMLSKIAQDEGIGSQKRKKESLLNLINQLDRLSAKYLIRIIIKKLRLGFSDMTILDALSSMTTGDKSLREEIEKTYNILADIGKVASSFKKEGLNFLKNSHIVVGIPVRPSSAERVPTFEEIFEKTGPCFLEPKIDGFRLQVHVDHSQKERIAENSLFEKEEPFVRFFSRNLENMTGMFPEIKEAVQKIHADSFILEGEAVAYDKKADKFFPFQMTISRKRKHGVQEKAKEVPLTLFIFDLIYLNGKSYLEESLIKRREVLEKLFPESQNLILTPQIEAQNPTEIKDYFIKQKENGLEGIMIKMKDSPYKAGSRGFHWIKYKRDENSGLEDTIDTVVLGYYRGEGKRTNFGIGALLVGIYNRETETFETIAKIGTGIKDEEFIDIKKDLDKIKTQIKPKNVLVPKNLEPDIWVSPEIVAVILADEITSSPLHSAAYALRFPRLIEWNRKDKTPQEITTKKEIKTMYQNSLK